MIRKYHPDGWLPTEGQVFIFGSNLAGRHGKGAALVATRMYGAVYGQGDGRMGQSYAIPTKDRNLRAYSPNQFWADVQGFIEYANEHPHEEFFITRVGCGLAGNPDKVVAPLFKDAPSNCDFPDTWKEFLE